MPVGPGIDVHRGLTTCSAASKFFPNARDVLGEKDITFLNRKHFVRRGFVWIIRRTGRGMISLHQLHHQVGNYQLHHSCTGGLSRIRDKAWEERGRVWDRECTNWSCAPGIFILVRRNTRTRSYLKLNSSFKNPINSGCQDRIIIPSRDIVKGHVKPD